MAAAMALRRAGPAPLSPLTLAIGVSVLLHALVLMVQFTIPELPAKLKEKALDIVLVNARSTTAPKDAQVLAQSNLDGGGNTDEDRRVKTPLPPTAQQAVGSDLEQMQRRVKELEARQQQILTQARSLRESNATKTGTEQPAPTPTPSGFSLAENARAMARLEGEIGRNLEEYGKRPRRKNIGARAEEYRFAQYIEDWRLKVERVGTLNYPEAAKGKLYGSLVLTIIINADGTLAQPPVVSRSSGFKVLDDAARRIVQLAAPYAPFPPDIRRDTDILEITRTWYFTQGDQISAQ